MRPALTNPWCNLDAKTITRYERAVQRFDVWLAGRPASDQLAQEYVNGRWRHEAMGVSEMGDLLAALTRLHPGVAWPLLRVAHTRADVATPVAHYKPMPAIVLRAFAVVCFCWGLRSPRWLDIGLAAWLAFDCQAHPGEVLHARRRHLQLGSELMAPFGNLIIEDPKTAKRYARSQYVQFSETFLLRCLEARFRDPPPGHAIAPLFPFSRDPESFFRAHFDLVLGRLQIPTGHPHGLVPAGLRSGGATAFFQATGSLDRTQWQGRWAQRRTLETYLQETAAASLVADLPRGVRRLLTVLAQGLPILLQDGLLPALSARRFEMYGSL